MDAREGDEMFSMFSSVYTASSGAVVQSANMVSNVTTQTVASVYGVVSGGVGMIGKAGVWVYDSTVAVASAVWDLTKLSIYVVCAILGVYLISQVGPGLKQISTTTQNSSKKRKLK
jgi:ABC-type polysaccharide/polyol phosphate export permease